VGSGLLYYLYNELATLTIAKTSALTMSVANTAKRAFVIVGVSVALGKAAHSTAQHSSAYSP
jgi:solute carrier family 35 protein E1